MDKTLTRTMAMGIALLFAICALTHFGGCDDTKKTNNKEQEEFLPQPRQLTQEERLSTRFDAPRVEIRERTIHELGDCQINIQDYGDGTILIITSDACSQKLQDTLNRMCYPSPDGPY